MSKLSKSSSEKSWQFSWANFFSPSSFIKIFLFEASMQRYTSNFFFVTEKGRQRIPRKRKAASSPFERAWFSRKKTTDLSYWNTISSRSQHCEPILILLEMSLESAAVFNFQRCRLQQFVRGEMHGSVDKIWSTWFYYILLPAKLPKGGRKEGTRAVLDIPFPFLLLLPLPSSSFRPLLLLGDTINSIFPNSQHFLPAAPS